MPKVEQIVVGVAQLVEPWIVIPVVVGSSPIIHPILFMLAWFLVVAGRLNHASHCDPIPPLWAVSSVGRAGDS